jgi:hypothetical protein
MKWLASGGHYQVKLRQMQWLHLLNICDESLVS